MHLHMSSLALKTATAVSVSVAVAWYLLIPRKVSATSAWVKMLYLQTVKSSNLRYILISSILLSLAVRRLGGLDNSLRKRSFLASLAIVSFAYYKLFIVEHAKSRFQRTHFNVQVAERAGLTQELFRPTPWAFAAPGQTISCLAVSAFFDRLFARPLVFHREVVSSTFDGNSQFLDWARFETEDADRAAFSELSSLRRAAKRKWGDASGGEEEQAEDEEQEQDITPIVLVIHGFGESRHHPPIQRFARRARELGWRAVVWSYWRFDFGEVRDLKAVVEHIRTENPSSPIIAVGWSAGGYILFRYLEEYGDETGLSCAVGLSPLQDPITAIHLSKETQNRVYSLYLNHLAKITARRHIRADQTLGGERKALERLVLATADAFELYDRFLYELPGGFSRSTHSGSGTAGFSRPTYSFRGPTLPHYRPTSADIQKVKVPTLVVHANDDPIVAGHIHDWGDLVRRNRNILAVTTDRGGHEGHYDGLVPGGSTWDMRVAVRFISAVLETQAQIRHVEFIVDRKLLASPSESGAIAGAHTRQAPPFRSTQSFASLAATHSRRH